MQLGARIQAAIEVLEDVLNHHRPAAVALSDWGARHRFAGSGDRAAIGTLVYDALRRKMSLAAQMGEGSPRALALAAAPRAYGLDVSAVAASVDGSRFAPEALSDEEAARVGSDLNLAEPPYVLADVPEWLWPSFERALGARAVEEGRAMTRRAPIDLRANTLKTNREKVVRSLQRFSAQPTSLSPVGVRICPPEGAARSPHVEAEAGHGKGWFEVQDEGSQVAALLSGARAGMQVLDLCAGAGGKTLALAGQMANTGQIYAYDADNAQLRPIFDRLRRAGVRNAQVLEGGDSEALNELGRRFDVVLIDAPCTGSGTWRRRPDSKWRLKPGSLEQRVADQQAVLSLAAKMVKPGGQITYVTCSVLPEENVDQVAWFLSLYNQFELVPMRDVWQTAFGTGMPVSADGRSDTLLLTPASHGTDGFFIARFAAAAE